MLMEIRNKKEHFWNYKKQLEEMKHYILSRTNIDEKTFNKNRSKDWYLTSNELMQFNVIDKFVDTFEDILWGVYG